MRQEAVSTLAFSHSVGNQSQHLYAKTTWYFTLYNNVVLCLINPNNVLYYNTR